MFTNNSTIATEKYFKMIIHLKESLGLNAMTISDLTGIPRPTVLRKLNKLVKTNWITKDNNGLYKILPNEKNYKNLNTTRIENINKLSSMLSKFYNTARLENI